MRESLNGILGEGTANIVLFIILFAVILAVIFVVYAIIKRFSGQPAHSRPFTHTDHAPSPRLSVVDAAMVDDQRKLVLVRRDDVEHLILIGGPTDVVVEHNIPVESHDFLPDSVTSRITDAQIARYQNNQSDELSDDFDLGVPARPIMQQASNKLAYNNTIPEPEKAPAPSFAPEPRVDAPILREPVIQAKASVQPQSYRSEAATPAPTSAPTSAPAYVAPPVPAFTKAETPAPVQSVKPVAPQQPRTVTPAAPVAKPTRSAHPAYPLSQVSHGVLTSTSGTTSASVTNAAVTTATVAVAATTIVATSSRMDTDEQLKASSLEDVMPATSAPGFNNPQRSFASERTEVKSEPSFDLKPAQHNDDFFSLDDALDQALFSEPQSDKFDNAPSFQTKNEEDMAFMLEEELLSSLDIDIDADISVDIEDEMEKLLGELTINPER
ncbi:hypothetical protein ACLBWZ_14500 [Brucellaceae bacterium C25G]